MMLLWVLWGLCYWPHWVQDEQYLGRVPDILLVEGLSPTARPHRPVCTNGEAPHLPPKLQAGVQRRCPCSAVGGFG